jgi:plastocyanin
MGKELQDQKSQPIGIYGIYGRLLLKAHCSMATLAQTLRLNGQPIQPNQAYLLEQDALIQVAVSHASNTPLLLALVWAVTQKNYQQLDNWFSAAILTYPINLNAQSAPDAQSTPTPTPTPDIQLIQNPEPPFSPLSAISVGSSASQSGSHTMQQVKIVKKDGKYAFDPSILIVPKGTTVEWINNSDTAQTVVSDTNAFSASSSCGPTQTIQMLFNTPGAFSYHSGTNPDAKAVVIVTAS